MIFDKCFTFIFAGNKFNVRWVVVPYFSTQFKNIKYKSIVTDFMTLRFSLLDSNNSVILVISLFSFNFFFILPKTIYVYQLKVLNNCILALV